MPIERSFFAAGVIKGKIYAVGGFNHQGQLVNNLEAYDPATNSWIERASMPTRRADLGVGVINVRERQPVFGYGYVDGVHDDHDLGSNRQPPRRVRYCQLTLEQSRCYETSIGDRGSSVGNTRRLENARWLEIK